METPKKSVNQEKYGRWLVWALIALYGAACLYLYYMQSIQPLDYNNRYFQSDLPYHISMIVDDGWYYSFTAYAYQLLYYLCGKTTVGIALFLAVVTVASVLLTEQLLRRMTGQDRQSTLTLAAALILNLVMPLYLEAAGSYRYVSYQSGNLWHNSTYLCMRLLALAALLYYQKLEEVYHNRITMTQWLVFAVLLVVCTGVKPSFLTVFAPVLAFKLLWDLCHGVRFRQVFCLGASVLPACGVILWQNMVLFGEDTGNGMTFAPWYTFSLHADRPKLAVLCSLAFPLVVLAGSLLALTKEQWRQMNNGKGEAESKNRDQMRLDRWYVFIWMMTLVGFAEALCLVETGSRSRDGNFLWGYLFAVFLLYVVSLVKWLSLLHTDRTLYIWRRRERDAVQDRSTEQERGTVQERATGQERGSVQDRATGQKIRWILVRAAFVLAGLVLLYQLWCGVYFFIRLVCGETYFMMR